MSESTNDQAAAANDQAAAANDQAKKPWHPSELRLLGDVQTLTEAGGSAIPDAGVTGPSLS